MTSESREVKAAGTFEVILALGDPELDGVVGRYELSKRFDGDFIGVGDGVMLAAGDPATGEAGYVAIETVDGELNERRGGFAMQQFGTMHAGDQTLHYEVVPGSGRGELAGITGTLALTIEPDGTHRYELDYEL